MSEDNEWKGWRGQCVTNDKKKKQTKKPTTSFSFHVNWSKTTMSMMKRQSKTSPKQTPSSTQHNFSSQLAPPPSQYTNSPPHLMVHKENKFFDKSPPFDLPHKSSTPTQLPDRSWSDKPPQTLVVPTGLYKWVQQRIILKEWKEGECGGRGTKVRRERRREEKRKEGGVEGKGNYGV